MEPYQPFGSLDETFFARRQQAAKQERSRIRRIGLFAGGAILLYILLQNVLVILLKFTGLLTLYQSEPLLQTGVDSLLILCSLLPPFLLIIPALRQISGAPKSLPLDKPTDGGQFLLAIPAGLGFCILANQVTSYLTVFLSSILERFELEAVSAELPMPSGILGVTAAFFRIVVVAAICEEFCFRGVVMQNLRRFGDWFAIWMAALVFGLMHCNLIQAPFALIVGVALGYLCIKTGTLWTAVLIHALNNLLSMITAYLLRALPEQTVNRLYFIVTGTILVLGLFCAFLFVIRQRRKEAGQPSAQTLNGFWAKTGAFLSNPTMLIAIGCMLYFTSQFVKAKAAG